MKSLSGREFAELLEANGWVMSRVSGSHHIYTKQGRRERISAPIHGNRPLKKGLQAALMKLAEIKKDSKE